MVELVLVDVFCVCVFLRSGFRNDVRGCHRLLPSRILFGPGPVLSRAKDWKLRTKVNKSSRGERAAKSEKYCHWFVQYLIDRFVEGTLRKDGMGFALKERRR